MKENYAMLDTIAIFSKNLKYYREKALMSQSQLAKKINTQTAVISRYELGDALPRIDVLVKIATALNVSPNKLLNFTRSNVQSSLKLANNAGLAFYDTGECIEYRFMEGDRYDEMHEKKVTFSYDEFVSFINLHYSVSLKLFQELTNATFRESVKIDILENYYKVSDKPFCDVKG
jgi:transcriptional regulator with XRE-family HTH domain